VIVSQLAAELLRDTEAAITELGRKAMRSGRAHREYETWHAGINNLLDQRDQLLRGEIG